MNHTSENITIIRKKLRNNIYLFISFVIMIFFSGPRTILCHILLIIVTYTTI